MSSPARSGDFRCGDFAVAIGIVTRKERAWLVDELGAAHSAIPICAEIDEVSSSKERIRLSDRFEFAGVDEVIIVSVCRSGGVLLPFLARVAIMVCCYQALWRSYVSNGGSSQTINLIS